MGGGGEGDFDSVGECIPNLHRSVYGDREGKENGSFNDFRTERLGYGGGDGDLDEAGEGVLGRSVTRISNSEPNTNMNIFITSILTEYEYRIYSFQ